MKQFLVPLVVYESIRQMSGQVSRGSAGEYHADEHAGGFANIFSQIVAYILTYLWCLFVDKNYYNLESQIYLSPMACLQSMGLLRVRNN